VITVALFAADTFSAALLVYQQLAASGPVIKPYAISKDKAIKIALDPVNREPRRDAAFLPDKQDVTKLVHVIDNEPAFVTDEDSLADMWLYSNDYQFMHSGYLWHVDVTRPTPTATGDTIT
jgi:hypothetical protein